MASVPRFWSGVVLLCVFVLVPTAVAQNEQLQAAVELFEQQDYKAAQEALLEVPVDELTGEEQAQLEALLEELPLAIQGSEKALQDLTRADEAYEAGEWDEAGRLYHAVEENKYARLALREYAEEQCERIHEKQGLAEAAKPSGTVEEAAPPEAQEPPEASAVEEEPAIEKELVIEEVPARAVPVEGPRRLTPTDQLRLRDELLWQRAVAKAQAASKTAREAMAQNDYLEARRLLDTAGQTIEAARRYADPVSKYQAARDGVRQLRIELEQRAEAYEQAKATEEREEIRDRIEQRKQLYEQQKAEKIEQLFNSANQLRREQRFGEAAEVLREVLRIDPGNAKARYQLDVVEDYESFARQSQWQHDVYTQQRQALVNAEEALIPWDIDVLYPKNWLELSARRGLLTQGAAADIEDVELNRKLKERLPEVRIQQQPFEQVIEWLAEMQNVNIAVDWTDLQDNGIERDAALDINLVNLTFRTILEEVLAQVGGETELAYAVGEGLLRVATKEKLDKDKLILIYDIRDMLVNIPRASRMASFDVTQGMGQQGSGQGGGGGQGMFGEGNQQGGQRGGQDQYDQGGLGSAELIQRIMDIIRQTVEPDSWRETGGGDASIRELNGQLIIYNTSDSHRQVSDLLSQLRETRALQISVETRFLNVVSNFLEQFGVDLDFVFNSGSAGYDRAVDANGNGLIDPFTGAPLLIDRRFTRMGVLPATPAFGTPLTQGAVPQQPFGQAGLVPSGTGVSPHLGTMTPVTAQQGSLSLVDPTAINTNVPGSWAQRSGLSPALNIAGSFLDNLQVDFLIRATQANARSSIVQAPRLVLFNGQASSISVGRSREYVSSLEPRVAEGVGTFQPITANADSGVWMFVEATISADRRYVTMTVSVQQRDEPMFERFEVQRASGNSPGSFIMLRDQAFARLETTVSVPDGGTVLLGGLKQVGEVEMEAGVPILSKIPILKRAFTNTTTVKDTRTLLILLKAKIIIQKEAEDEAFPTFTRAGV